MPLPRLLLWLPDLPPLPPSQFIILSSNWKDDCKGKPGFQDAHGGDAHPTSWPEYWGPMLSSLTSPGPGSRSLAQALFYQYPSPGLLPLTPGLPYSRSFLDPELGWEAPGRGQGRTLTSAAGSSSRPPAAPSTAGPSVHHQPPGLTAWPSGPGGHPREPCPPQGLLGQWTGLRLEAWLKAVGTQLM